MKASQTVYLTEDKKKAVAEGDPSARFLLVRAGAEIAEGRYKNVEGAEDLIGAKSKKADKEEPKKAAKH